MTLLATVISIIYYIFIAYAICLMIANLIKAKHWEKEVLYIVVIIPFLLRLLRLK